MKFHGNTGKRNAAKAPEKVKQITKSLRLTPDEIAAHDTARGSVSWSKWARNCLSNFADSGKAKTKTKRTKRTKQ